MSVTLLPGHKKWSNVPQSTIGSLDFKALCLKVLEVNHVLS